ncbi:hypothetical protein C6P46_004052 [Rhodotorula mucilaginosa]|uniref:Protein kinase domain-containing protein n=1 Tax=Rhodotorula mucilaginosa TaxID=5537 RepID=A0A9P6W341_RHOMI|nr:hypothetical protein C6P46_004052 [Rhodotorula mucilaginosa]
MVHLLDYISGQPPTHHRKKHYIFKDTLGTGGFATVKQGTSKDDGREVAIKIIDKDRIRDHAQQVYRQNTLMTLKHEHIIELIEWFESKNHYFLVFELAAGGELFDHLIESPNCRFSEAEAREVMYALVDGVKYLHERNIVHRDLKPENVLYRTPPGSHPEVGHDDCVISDFGLAAYVDPNGGRLYTIAGSAGYSAPEMYPPEGIENGQGRGNGQSRTTVTDFCAHPAAPAPFAIWGTSKTAFCCLGGRFPYKKTEPVELAEEARTTELYFPRTWETVSEEAKDFIRKLLTVDETERMSAAEAIQHPVRQFGGALSLALWLRAAISRPPSPAAGVGGGAGQRAKAPAMLGPMDAVPNEHNLGATLSRTETITDDAPLIEKRTTFTTEVDQRAIV